VPSGNGTAGKDKVDDSLQIAYQNLYMDTVREDAIFASNLKGF